MLFSGGLDCTTLALLADQYIPSHQTIDLINVAFENPRSLSNMSINLEGVITDTFSVPDRKTGHSSWTELCQLAPGRSWRFVKVDVSISEYFAHKAQIIQLMKPNFTVMDLVRTILFCSLLSVSVMRESSNLKRLTFVWFF